MDFVGLKDKHVIVTGASGGLGLVTAREFLGKSPGKPEIGTTKSPVELGAKVTLHYNSTSDTLTSLLEAYPKQVVALKANVSDEKEVAACLAEAVRVLGPPNVLIVNHGIWPTDDISVKDMSLDRWQKTIDVNLTGSFLFCREFLRAVEKHAVKENVAIVFVGSTAGKFGEAFHSDYASTKSALMEGFKLSLKNEIAKIAPKGRVNAVAPGWIRTPMADKAMQDPELMFQAMASSPLRKISEPEDVARDFRRYYAYAALFNIPPIYIFYPLRTVRVLQQAALKEAVSDSISDVLRARVRTGGFSALFHGSISFMIGSTLGRLIQFGAYDTMKLWVERNKHRYEILQQETPVSMAMGSIAAVTVVTLLMPFEVFSQQLTVDMEYDKARKVVSKGVADHPGTSTAKASTKPRTSIPVQPQLGKSSARNIHTTQKLIPPYHAEQSIPSKPTFWERVRNEGGIRKFLFRGYNASLLSALPFCAVYYSVYEASRKNMLHLIQQNKPMSETQFTKSEFVGVSLGAGLLASFTACLASAPTDLVKTRIQTSRTEHIPVTPVDALNPGSLSETAQLTASSQASKRLPPAMTVIQPEVRWWAVAKQVYQEGGIKGFYRGLNARMWTSVPFGALNFLIFDFMGVGLPLALFPFRHGGKAHFALQEYNDYIQLRGFIPQSHFHMRTEQLQSAVAHYYPHNASKPVAAQMPRRYLLGFVALLLVFFVAAAVVVGVLKVDVGGIALSAIFFMTLVIGGWVVWRRIRWYSSIEEKMPQFETILASMIQDFTHKDLPKYGITWTFAKRTKNAPRLDPETGQAMAEYVVSVHATDPIVKPEDRDPLPAYDTDTRDTIVLLGPAKAGLPSRRSYDGHVASLKVKVNDHPFYTEGIDGSARSKEKRPISKLSLELLGLSPQSSSSQPVVPSPALPDYAESMLSKHSSHHDAESTKAARVSRSAGPAIPLPFYIPRARTPSIPSEKSDTSDDHPPTPPTEPHNLFVLVTPPSRDSHTPSGPPDAAESSSQAVFPSIMTPDDYYYQDQNYLVVPPPGTTSRLRRSSDTFIPPPIAPEYALTHHSYMESLEEVAATSAAATAAKERADEVDLSLLSAPLSSTDGDDASTSRAEGTKGHREGRAETGGCVDAPPGYSDAVNNADGGMVMRGKHVGDYELILIGVLSTVNSLATAMKHVQSSFSAISNNLTANFQQSAAMAQHINSVMEQLLIQNLIISTQVKQQEAGVIAVTITLRNQGQIPLFNLQGSIEFDQTPYNARQGDCDLRTTAPVPPSEPLIFSLKDHLASPQTLSPNATLVQRLLIEVTTLQQWNARIICSFVSPGTGEPLQKKSGFGIYIIDQLVKQVLEPELAKDVHLDSLHLLDTCDLKAQFVRDIFLFNPMMALAKGTVITLKSKKTLMHIVIQDAMSLEDESSTMVASCAFYTSAPGDEHIARTCAAIIKELDVLNAATV
ncbi:hypothetical protein BZG36_01082 [Bifiguratus adelaidae]|uniref:Uncharacterized protein n=1 Tax=Bifiguratus adelaidae TaxID=1938954 RepID=A0A261Y634_9FUNG|nr:hypothetical protein BZG36_01082 [Bifiguratus adelaidae]